MAPKFTSKCWLGRAIRPTTVARRQVLNSPISSPPLSLSLLPRKKGKGKEEICAVECATAAGNFPSSLYPFYSFFPQRKGCGEGKDLFECASRRVWICQVPFSSSLLFLLLSFLYLKSKRWYEFANLYLPPLPSQEMGGIKCLA